MLLIELSVISVIRNGAFFCFLLSKRLRLIKGSVIFV
ncbi:hypothetical protein AsAng_0034040 [Aureispira anguillae]|uniref:Uncharacterized protein n=1 Tax=Aureispira anguillae TaxID=2864201 RepID=A0A915YGD9_9BACT|nr:hypothetical protein AsAng_0034040 [Aureispira anguillae]